MRSALRPQAGIWPLHPPCSLSLLEQKGFIHILGLKP